MPFDRVTLIFNNSQCIPLLGCVLYGYKDGQEVGKDGVRPVQKQDGYRFEVRSPGMTHWRWVAAADYSDRPENEDVVMVDTGKRELTKEDWKITCTLSGPGGMKESAEIIATTGYALE
jgi:hypothetical protein